MSRPRKLKDKKRNGLPRTRAVRSDVRSLPAVLSPLPVKIGVVEWFRPGEHEHVKQVLADLKPLGVTHLRTGVSWADWHTSHGEEWYDWLLPTLAREVSVLPCFLYTPPSLGVAPKTSAPPRDPKAYADFIDQMISRFGRHFEWVELWNEPNSLRHWDVTLDPQWLIFSRMVSGAAYWAKQRGKKTVLGGTGPIDPRWVNMMGERGVLDHIDAIGVHGFPLTYELNWDGWSANVTKVCDVLDRYGSAPEIWITETGYSTWRYDERRQLSAFVEAIKAPVKRVYWYAARDLDPAVSTADAFHRDEREYHFGLMRADGTPKLLYRLWASEGLETVRRATWLGESARGEHKRRPVLITGGAGFVGTNLAHRLLSSGRPVLLFDSLSRPGVERNLQWLRETHRGLLQIEIADVRNRHALRSAVEKASQVYHFAAQVAVTTSLTGPVHDFEVNARGTLNLLEALRALKDPPPLIFTSTNKVYGGLEDVLLVKNGSRYQPEDPLIRANGINEDRPLDFHSPYGCSKGTADQYIIDYARTFSIPAVVFRMSCIYGPHQFGTEDQGWVAHFLIQAIEDKPLTLYGDGKQVRDLLFIEDLVNAFLLAQENIDALAGQAFNIGGGPTKTTSLLELIGIVTELRGERPVVRFAKWRPGDQRYYVSDTRKFQAATDWSPRVGVRQGVKKLYQWLLGSRGIASAQLVAGKEPYEIRSHQSQMDF
jgi:CDP-paratose 2-epimerase